LDYGTEIHGFIGSGANAQEAYKAINSERNLGLVIVGFIETTEELEKQIY
jgi:undecaprenyl-phosphate galactose phosphotransferase